MYPDDASGRFYLPQLDGLRFCAFLLVFLHHSPVMPGGRVAAAVTEFGWIGVDLFFLLSAYLLTALLHREHAATGTADIGKFFVRRVLRIWPLFYFYVAACFLYYVATDGSDLAEVTGRTLGHLFFVDNFFSVFADEYNPLTFTPHLWTIAFEEQVYLFIPLLFAGLIALRRNARLFALTMAAVIVLQPLLRWGLTRFHYDELTLWTVPFVHADSIVAGLLLGAGVGAGLKDRIPGDILALAGALVLGVLLLVLPAGEFGALWAERGIYFFSVLALAFSLILLGCLSRRSALAVLLAREPFVFLGRISYGLYVWHAVGNYYGPYLVRRWVVAVPDSAHEVLRWAAAVVPSLALTAALAAASYVLLERPFLRMKRRFTVVHNRED